MREIADKATQGSAYFNDDTLRTLMLFARGLETARKNQRSTERPTRTHQSVATAALAAGGNTGGFYVYENWTNKRARMHRAGCSHCNAGEGSHGATGDKNGRWYGPFGTVEDARIQLGQFEYQDTRECGVCM